MASDERRRAIGKVISVAADRFVVELHRGNDNFTVVGFDDVHYVAALGSFVVLPVQSEYVVAEVVGLWEKDPSSGRLSEHSNDLDKAGSAKFLELVPVGMLAPSRSGFRFGVSVFPSLYTDALYVLDDELDRIFEVADWEEPVPSKAEGQGPLTRIKALSIGTSVVFKGYDVKVRVDDYFGGHVAVLGNTGSGKSCTVASVLQSLFEKKDEIAARGATFVLLDVNGEYRAALSGLPVTIRRSYMRVAADPADVPTPPLDANERTSVFRLPHWFMSVEEWELLLRASERTQQPVLRSALGLTSLFSSTTEESKKVRRHIVAMCVNECFRGVSGDSPVSKAHRLLSLLDKFGDDQLNRGLLAKYGFNLQYGNFPQGAGTTGFLDELKTFILDSVNLPSYTGLPFEFSTLEECFEVALLYEEAHGNKQIRDYCAQMITRFKWIKEREEFAFLRVSPTALRHEEQSAGLFIENMFGLFRKDGRLHKSEQIVILDMNEAADEVVEVVSAVIRG